MNVKPLFLISATCPYSGDTLHDRYRATNFAYALAYAQQQYPHPWKYEIQQHIETTDNV